MKNNDLSPKRFQFSLASILFGIGVLGVLLGLWTWLSETIPGALAAVIILCWACGLALLSHTSPISIDDNGRRGVVQFLFGLGCGAILIGPLIAVVVWSVWNGGK